MKHVALAVLLCAFAAPLCAAPASDSVSLDELLEKVKAGRVQDNKANAQRLKAFRNNKAQQAQLLAAATAKRAAGEARSQALEAEFEKNDVQAAELENALTERLGSLKELFGVLQQAAGDARGQFESSLTHVQFPERVEFLNQLTQKMGQTSRLASIEEIERLWFELQREMTESGKVVRFTTKVITSTGAEVEQDVIRIGAFNVIAGDKYLQFKPESGNLVELPRQPQQRYREKLDEFSRADSGLHAVGIDPTRGQLLSLIIQLPNVMERIQQGGVVGYVIIGLGVLALLVALERLISLSVTGARIASQRRKLDQPGNNPLGRILKVYQNNPQADTETLELKLSEAILHETPRISRMLMLLKIIAVVAPLLGLLGTVTGMIITFQAITLYGTGDPKLIAGGLSQALMTTVMGLIVAIPTVLMHTLVASRARRLNQILEEQAAGLIAAKAEHQHAAR